MNPEAQNIIFQYFISGLITIVFNLTIVIYRVIKSNAFKESSNKTLTTIIYFLYFFILTLLSFGFGLTSRAFTPFYLLTRDLIGYNPGLLINIIIANILAATSFKLGFTLANYLTKRIKAQKKYKHKKMNYTFARDWYGLILTGFIHGCLLFLAIPILLLFFFIVFLAIYKLK